MMKYLLPFTVVAAVLFPLLAQKDAAVPGTPAHAVVTVEARHGKSGAAASATGHYGL